ncbi:MAG: hypothetical protein HF312_02625 [Ignavibacteria bacterium]|jgi:hypothetical protein|nr:hypothetical protein [Ignavibacteria bacterium]MCU7519080.1 hypothetical protein [Ignavibacteria bacterium]
MKRLFLLLLLLPPGIWLILSQVNYQHTKTYPAQQISPEVIAWIEKEAHGKQLAGIEDICDFSNQIVSEHLSYRYSSSVRNPNLAWQTRNVNCLGYGSLQAAVITYLLQKYKIQDWYAEQHSCRTRIGNFWLGSLSPELGYHTYSAVINRKTHEKIIPDACMYDLIRAAYNKEL